MRILKDLLPTKEVVYGQPPVLVGKSSPHEGFEWYRDFIDYNKVKELTANVIGKVAILDDTAQPTNDYIAGNIDTIYEFTNENGVSGFHGHHVTGIVASKKHGLFPNNRIGLFKVLSARNGLGVTRWIVSGIESAQIEGYEVINASLGADRIDNKITAAVTEYVSDIKRFFVCASGNDAAKTDYPAALSKELPGVISVGAVEHDKNEFKIATFSSFGAVTVVAAGVDVLSTFPNNKEEYLSGTSMATPFIAGMIAAAKAIYPAFTQHTFYQVISRCSIRLSNAEVTHQGYGFVKVVDFLEAVTDLSRGIPLDAIQTNVAKESKKEGFLQRLKRWLKL